MPMLPSLTIFIIFTFALAVIGFIAFKAFTSPLRPFYIVAMAWKTAITSVVSSPLPLVFAVGLIGTGRILQRIANAFPNANEAMMLPLSIGWQAVLQMSLAMVAVRLHIRTIELVKSRYGLDDFYLNRSETSKLMWSALYGGLIWLIVWTTLAAARLFIGLVETDHPAFVTNGMSFMLYLLASLFMLVRPAYSLELPSPFKNGIMIAVKTAPSLLAIQACLLVPIILYNIAFAKFSTFIANITIASTLVGDTIFILFSAIQFISVEIAAVMLVARCELRRYVYKKSYG